MLKNKLIATARCHPTEKADNHGVAEGEDGYFNGTTGLPVGIHGICHNPGCLDCRLKSFRRPTAYSLSAYQPVLPSWAYILS